MKKYLVPVLLLAAVASSMPAQARDERLRFPIDAALNSPTGKEKLTPEVKLFFGAQKFPKPQKDYGTFVANKKTNGFATSDQSACQTAFLSALISLQDRARKMGGNAVVHIHSYYKRDEVSSETDYECGAGGFVSGVALIGDVVSLP